ncbi:MAG: hypothetical protein LBL61_06030, partial [Elusimicrobiota bacterium]|nr:hypothetical protein [Elusimicrobiota bacterium]
MKIYQEIIKDKNDKKIKIFGLTIYRKTFSDGFIKHKYIKGIFKTETKCNYKIFYFLGIKIYERLNIKQELIDIRAIIST